MNKHGDFHSGQTLHYDALVLSDEHLYMWNIVPNEIRLNDRLRQVREIRQPFWVDEQSIAHVLPENLFANTPYTKRKYPSDNITAAMTSEKTIGNHQEISVKRPRFSPSSTISHIPGQRWIKIISVNDLPSILRTFPQMRLLLIDQYEMFAHAQDKTPTNLTFLFTGAPIRGLLSESSERQFWQRIETQSQLHKDVMAYPPEDDHKDITHPTSPAQADKGRQCNRVWRYFIPNADYLVRDGKTQDTRVVDIHLMDSNDTLIWRNLIRAFIENEQQEQQGIYQRQHNVLTRNDTLPSHKLTLMIRLRYCVKDARDRAEEKRATWRKTGKFHHKLENYLTYLTLGEAKLRFKRFAAFFIRVIEQKKDMPNAPHLFWTMRDDEQPIIRLIYHEIFRETLKGKLNNVVAYHRFLSIEQPINTKNCQDDAGKYHRNKGHLIISKCPMREPTIEQKNADNVLGIMQNVLLNNNVFSSDVYFISPGNIYIEKHKSRAPIYKLRTQEI